MTNFQQELEQLLKDYNGFDFCGEKVCSGQNKATELEKALTSLFLQTIEQSKPGYVSLSFGEDITRRLIIDQYHQNIVKNVGG